MSLGSNVADDYNEFEYHYDWFESEMGEGTPVKGETYEMYNGDINNYCGAIIYSFNVFNLDGEDVTAVVDGYLDMLDPILLV
jgi:hypothetical protein